MSVRLSLSLLPMLQMQIVIRDEKKKKRKEKSRRARVYVNVKCRQPVIEEHQDYVNWWLVRSRPLTWMEHAIELTHTSLASLSPASNGASAEEREKIKMKFIFMPNIIMYFTSYWKYIRIIPFFYCGHARCRSLRSAYSTHHILEPLVKRCVTSHSMTFG